MGEEKKTNRGGLPERVAQSWCRILAAETTVAIITAEKLAQCVLTVITAGPISQQDLNDCLEAPNEILLVCENMSAGEGEITERLIPVDTAIIRTVATLTERGLIREADGLLRTTESFASYIEYAKRAAALAKASVVTSQQPQ